MSYINRKGGRVRALDQLTVQIWKFLEERNSVMVAYFVPSAFNLADSLSRQMTKSLARELDTEWQLNPEVFAQVCQELQFQPEVDLFATST